MVSSPKSRQSRHANLFEGVAKNAKTSESLVLSDTAESSKVSHDSASGADCCGSCLLVLLVFRSLQISPELARSTSC